MSWDAELLNEHLTPIGEWNYMDVATATAWLAGLMEGEGCFRFRHNPARKRGHPDVQLNMTDEDVVRRAAAVAGVGTIHGPYIPGGNRQPYWVWKVSAANDAARLMLRLYPLLGERRRAVIVDVLARWHAQRPAVTGRKPRP